MPATVKPGDVVRLASGGTPMTVIGETGASLNFKTPLAAFLCYWFDKSGSLCQGYFVAESLVAAQPYP